MNRRQLLAALPLPFLAGCIGSFALTRRVYDWNRGLGSPVVQEVVFLLLLFIPVYSATLFIDGVLLNTLEFITGSNPLAKGGGAEEGDEAVAELAPGARLRLRRRGGRVEVALLHADGRRSLRRVEPSERGLRLVDEHDQLVAEALPEPDGGVVVLGADGAVLARYGAEHAMNTAFAWETLGAEAAVQTALGRA